MRRVFSSASYLCALFIAAVIALPTPAQSQGRAECSVIKSELLARNVRYCAFLPPSFDQDKTRTFPVLYYLHGLGDSEQSLLNFGGWDLIEELRTQGKVGDFVVLAPAGGHTFFINSADGKVRYEDFLMKEFMPQLEKKYRASGTRATRGITGTSMGGYGALRLAFKYPDEFAAVSGQMPALIPDVPENFNAGGSGSPSGAMADAFGSPFNRAYFEHNNVFTFAKNDPAAELKRLKIYFDVGNNDDFGFERGGEQLHYLLDARGVPNEFHIYPGRHDPQFVMKHFASVIEFQWKAIGK